jgi:ubiquinone/menaquinone biosynthesis C-methylase UbiE
MKDKGTLAHQKSYYNRKSVWSKNYWNKDQESRANETLKLLPTNAKSVLDLGCGGGIITEKLKQKSNFVVGLDIARLPLESLREKDIAVTQADSLNLPFSDGSFDLIVATELIEHLTNSGRKKVLREIVRVTKKYILISVPYRQVLAEHQVKCNECGCIFQQFGHTYSFNKKTMKSLFSFNPNIKHKEFKTMGGPIKRKPYLLVKLAQIFGGYDKPHRNVICPQCGNTENFVSEHNLATFLFYKLPWRLFPGRARWIASLYKKT